VLLSLIALNIHVRSVRLEAISLIFMSVVLLVSVKQKEESQSVDTVDLLTALTQIHTVPLLENQLVEEDAWVKVLAQAAFVSVILDGEDMTVPRKQLPSLLMELKRFRTLIMLISLKAMSLMIVMLQR